MKLVGQILMTVLVAPFAIAVGLLVFGTLGLASIPMSVRGHFEHRAWLREMYINGRTITPSGIVDHGQSGTVIVDQPGWGGKAKYCWWTPDDVEALAPVDVTPLSDRKDALKFELRGDGTDLPLDSWVYEHYLSDESGTAYLVSTRNGDTLAENLTKKLAGLKIVETWTAPRAEFGSSNVKPGIAG